MPRWAVTGPGAYRVGMSLYAAFLRGMNVGGHRLTNDELRAHFTAMGFEDVATFRASGNVVFAGRAQPPARVAARIEQGLQAALGYAVPTFIRTAEQMRAMAAMRPFSAAQLDGLAGKLQVGVLGAAPAPDARERVLALAGADDLLAFGPCELYWQPRGGVLDSTLDLKRIDSLLGVLTMRTQGTVEQLAGKHFAAPPPSGA